MNNLTVTEEAKIIRKELKEKLNLNSRKVSVKIDSYSMGASINVNIKTLDALNHIEDIEEISKQFQSYDTCDYSGEILSGGNTFVFVKPDYELREYMTV